MPTIIYGLVGKRTGEMYRGDGFMPSALTVSVIKVLYSSMLKVQQDNIIPSVVNAWRGELHTLQPAPCTLFPFLIASSPGHSPPEEWGDGLGTRLRS